MNNHNGNDSNMERDQFVARLSEFAAGNNKIDPFLFDYFGVKRGLRNNDGTGVLVGLTQIGDVHGYIMDEGRKVPVEGRLRYRGINVEDIINGCRTDGRFGFEEVCFLLLFGKLPNQYELNTFRHILNERRALPDGFVEDVILKGTGSNIMNKLTRCILACYSYENDPDNLSISRVLCRCIDLIARMPAFVAYSYMAKRHYLDNKSLYIHNPKDGQSTAECFLHMVRPDSQYTRLEAETLDLALILHAEHGGANARVMEMIHDIQSHVSNWENESAVRDYLIKILDRKAFDHTGLIYGMGHAVYTLSDPRAVLLKNKAKELAKIKHMESEFALYDTIERITPELFAERKGKEKTLCANVDFYSGFVYKMLGIPADLYTPIFAIARMPGWCAHSMEELISGGKIIRPAYRTLIQIKDYKPLKER